MSKKTKKTKIVPLLGIALTPILFLVFFLMRNFYQNSAFETYLAYKSYIYKNEPNANLDYATPTIVGFYNDSLIHILIMPIFFAVGLSLFANYVFVQRVKYLENELKETKEKLDA